jgi:hypothetical protein
MCENRVMSKRATFLIGTAITAGTTAAAIGLAAHRRQGSPAAAPVTNPFDETEMDRPDPRPFGLFCELRAAQARLEV